MYQKRKEKRKNITEKTLRVILICVDQKEKEARDAIREYVELIISKNTHSQQYQILLGTDSEWWTRLIQWVLVNLMKKSGYYSNLFLYLGPILHIIFFKMFHKSGFSLSDLFFISWN